MLNTLFKLTLKLQDLTNSEQGQDLLEYALLLTLISLALISAIQGIAASIAAVFTNMSTTLA